MAFAVQLGQMGFLRSDRSGQALIEIVIASLILIFALLGITQAMVTSLRGIGQSLPKVTAIFLAQEEIESMRAIAKEDWHNITSLSTSSANLYYTVTSSGKWVTSSGSETITLNSITYTRYFYIDDVYRATSSATSTGNIVSSGGYFDPSTSKVTSYVSWTDAYGIQQSFSQVEYLSRFLNTTYNQTDWSGGSAGETTTVVTTTTFATSTSIDATTTPGSIILQTI